CFLSPPPAAITRPRSDAIAIGSSPGTWLSTRRKPDMNKAELIDAVSTKTGLQKAEATRAVDAVFDAVTEGLKGGDAVSLLGFGTFAVKARAARSGRNPRTGETIEIAATKVPGFK